MRAEGEAAVYTPQKRKLTADEYQRMGQAGILGCDERVELIEGELYITPPIGDGHVGKTIRLNFLFQRRVGDRALVSVQSPIRLSAHSEPEPDIVLVRPRPDFYETAKPRPEDIFLIVEVAETSLSYDRLTKLPWYAAAGIPEVWIVNLVERRIEVYRDPVGNRYATAFVPAACDTLTLVALPEVAIRVAEILG